MKPNTKTVAAKRPRVRRSAKPALNGRKLLTWTGFAPELCGVMSGPSDLSLREGFVRG